MYHIVLWYTTTRDQHSATIAVLYSMESLNKDYSVQVRDHSFFLNPDMMIPSFTRSKPCFCWLVGWILQQVDSSQSDPSPPMSVLDMTSDGEASVMLELWGM